jgi:membrane protease YdiL (CAAX protease family)
MKKIKKYFSIIKPLFYLFLLFIIATLSLIFIDFIISIILGLKTGEFDFEKKIISDIPHLGSLLLNITVALIYIKWYRKLKKNEADVKKNRIALKDLGFILLLGLGITFLVNGLLNLVFIVLEIYLPQIVSNYNDAMSYLYEGSLALIVLRTAIIVPIAEELVFRGVILKKANYIMPFYAANIVQAMLFGLVHINPIQIIYAFTTGLIDGYITMRYRSIIPSILMHILFNTYAVLNVAYKRAVDNPIDLSKWFFIVLTLIGASIFFVCYRMLKRDNVLLSRNP